MTHCSNPCRETPEEGAFTLICLCFVSSDTDAGKQFNRPQRDVLNVVLLHRLWFSRLCN